LRRVFALKIFFKKETPNGSHLLHLACLAGHEACIAMLLDWPQLYPISAKTSSGATALHFAVLSGNRAAVSLVLSRVEEVELEALLRSVWIRKLTAFHLAAMLGEVGVVAELLTRAKKSSLEVLDHTGSSPLHWAAYTGNAEIIRLLGDSGLCSFSTEDEEGNTPLALAVKHGCLTASEACAGHARAARSLAPSISATSLDTPLWIAMAKGPQFAKVVAEAMQKAEKMAATTNDDWTNTELYKPDFKFGEHENTLLHRAVMVFPDNACSDLIEQLKDNVQIVLNTHKQLSREKKNSVFFFQFLCFFFF
jgi:ankyrin repeat protein